MIHFTCYARAIQDEEMREGNIRARPVFCMLPLSILAGIIGFAGLLLLLFVVFIADREPRGRALEIDLRERLNDAACANFRLWKQRLAEDQSPFRQSGPGAVELYVRLPLRSELSFRLRPSLPAGSFAVSVESEKDQEWLTFRRGTREAWTASLARFDGLPVRLRFENRSPGALEWISPTVHGIAEPRPPVLDPSLRPPDRPINVLLYVIDTARFDRLADYGRKRVITPRLSELARRSITFTSAYATGSNTPHSVPALLASVHPSRLGGWLRADGPAHETLPEAFSRAGYRTGGFQANFGLTQAMGFGRGFDRYMVERVRFKELPVGWQPLTAAELHEQALEWLREQGEHPFFLYLQSMDVHQYRPPEPFLSRFTSEGRKAAYLIPTERELLLKEPDAALVAKSVDLYDGSYAYADHEIGRLLEAMRGLGLAERTVVVVTSDHGESLGQRGDSFHGNSLHEELVHVPLILHLPWGGWGTRIDSIVSLMDVAPTLLDLAGITIPPSFEGRSLLRPADGSEPDYAVGVGVLNRVAIGWYLRQGPWKLLTHPDGCRLFHVPSDPGETTDVSRYHPVEAGTLAGELTRRSPRFQPTWQEPPSLKQGLNRKQRKKLEEALRALGYAE